MCRPRLLFRSTCWCASLWHVHSVRRSLCGQSPSLLLIAARACVYILMLSLSDSDRLSVNLWEWAPLNDDNDNNNVRTCVWLPRCIERIMCG